jgi:hypothetical protein
VKPGFVGWLLLCGASLLLTAPARVADWLLADTPFCLIGGRGRLWAGSAWLAARGKAGLATPILPLSWRLSWQGAPAVELTTPQGIGGVRVGIALIHLDIPPFLVELSSLPLPPTVASHAPTGQLSGIDGQFDCGYRAACQGRASLRVENPMLALFPADHLGDIDVAIHANDQYQSARLVADGKAALAGEAIVSWRNGRLTISGDVRATDRASPGLTRTIASLKAAGTNSLSFGERWLDGGDKPSVTTAQPSPSQGDTR